MASIRDYLNTTDANFLNEYKNRVIYDDTSKKFYSIQNGVLAEHPDQKYQGSNYDFFNASQGLAPAGSGSYANSDAWRYKAVAPSAENSWLGMGSAGSPEVIANGGQPIKSGFSSLPIAGDSFIGMPTTTERPAETTFKAATAGSGAGAVAYRMKNPITGKDVDVPASEYQQRINEGWFDYKTPITEGNFSNLFKNQPPAGATLISGPSGLKGLTESQIWRDPNSNQIYKLPQATLTSPTGEKKVVTVGSQEASNLLNNNWTLGDKVGGGTITPDSFTGGNKIDTSGITAPTNFSASSVSASAASTATETDKNLAKEKADAEAKKNEVNSFMEQLKKDYGTAQSAESMQAAEEAKRNIDAKNAAVASANSALKAKLAEIDGLDKSYQNATLTNEGKTITLARIQGANNQALREYTIKKNLLSSEASLLQANVLGLQGELQAAQAAADKATSLRYQDQQFKLDSSIKILGLIQSQADTETAEYAALLERQYKLQDEQLQQQKTQENAVYAQKLDIITNYGVGSLTDTFEQLIAKRNASPILKAETTLKPVSGGGGGSSGGTTIGIVGATGTTENNQLVDSSGKVIKLSATQVDTVSGFDNTLKQIEAIKPLIDQVNTGPIAGRWSSIARMVGLDDPKRIELDAKFNSIKAAYLKALSGAAVSESEVKRLSTFLPSINDTEEVVKIKISELEQSINNQKNSFMDALGAVKQSTNDPLGLKNDPLNIR